ncbi:MAG TPA: hypothetical protein VGE88_14710 [Lysobacter sp.]
MDRAVMGTVYVLGFIGLVGIVLIPLRSFVVIRHLADFWNSSLRIRLLIAAFAAVAIFLLFAEAHLLIGISRCLLGEHCGANRTSGWTKVAGIGFWYVTFELTAFITSRAVGRMAAE